MLLKFSNDKDAENIIKHAPVIHQTRRTLKILYTLPTLRKKCYWIYSISAESMYIIDSNQYVIDLVAYVSVLLAYFFYQ